MKKIFTLLMLLVITITLTACNKDKKEDNNSNSNESNSNKVTDSIKFKEEYESKNGEKNSSGKKMRSVTIDEENPFIYSTADDIVSLIDDKETFLVYFGYSTCPWCRSIITTLTDVLKDNDVDKIYYVDIHDIRDVMELDENNKAVTKTKGSDGYYKLLDKLDKVLSDYTLSKDKKTINTGEKRIFAPNIIYVKEGKAKSITTGISDKQDDAYMELTDEMKKDSKKQIEKIVKEYISNNSVCSSKDDKSC